MTHATALPTSPWPHRLAAVLVCATFPLIWIGGLVTTTEAGMAVPDWPNTFGYNLLLYPWTTWLAGPWNVFVEHGHRLFAVVVGIITIGLTWSLWKLEPRPWLRTLGYVALVGVVFQGVLGGLRVVLDERKLALVHGCVGPAFFALAAALWHYTSRRFREHVRPTVRDSKISHLYSLALITTALAYVQLVLGAVVRHIPVYSPPSTFRAALLMHVAIGLLLTIHILLLAHRAFWSRSEVVRGVGLRGPALLLPVAIVAQLALGAATYVVNYGFPQWVGRIMTPPELLIRANGFPQVLLTTAHVAVGSLILATCLLLALRVRMATAKSPAASIAVACGGMLLREAAV